MKSIELLEAIGEARNVYIQDILITIRTTKDSTNSKIIPGDAKNDYGISGEASHREKQERHYLSTKRLWLIAAVIALMLLLVGCAVVYVLSLQDLVIGEHSPITQSPNMEGSDTISLISLQNINQPALVEWRDFLASYDPDGSLMVANDNNESGIPEPYHLVYNCYTWDMVEKLDEIAEKHNLRLLSQYVDLQAYAYNVLYEALNFESVIKENAAAQVEYLDSYFHLEGTFNASILITLPNHSEEMQVSLRYSKKDFFDPVVGSVGDVESYDQWHYVQADGIDLLLAANDESARIYADLSDAFVSVQTETLSKNDLEQLAEVFDFTIQPQSTTMEKANELMQIAESTHNDLMVQQQERLYGSGYAEYVTQLIEKYKDSPLRPENMTYALFDINGDGTEELIMCSSANLLLEIVSIKDGKTFHYFDSRNLPAFRINICKNNIIEIYSSYDDIFDSYEADHMPCHYFYFHADIDGASFITGLYKDQNAEWSQYLEFPEPDPRAHKLKAITDHEAQTIMSSYEQIELDMKPIADFPF